jgi:predicted dithiol-disulfide oxidoreductase (DUF899 family)
MTIRFPGESSEYRVARDRLLEQEIALRRQMETLASARRALPPGGVVPEDYVFDTINADGQRTERRLSALFEHESLLIYSMMFPRDPDDLRSGAASGQTAQLPLRDAPCPSCTALLDQLDGTVEHLAPLVDFVVVAQAPIERLATFALERGWRHLHLLSSASNHYNRDYHGMNELGAPRPMLNVFTREGDVTRHFWGSELLYAQAEPEQDPRHVGTLEPLWNMLDLTRQGRRRDWEEQLFYPCTCH